MFIPSTWSSCQIDKIQINKLMALSGTGQKPPGQKPTDISPRTKATLTKSPHNEVIIQSYYIFIY